MNRTIINYQCAYSKTVEKLKDKDGILGVFVFGSIVNGDLWEKSDIDLIVVQENSFSPENINIYSEENKVPVHIRLICKDKLIRLCKGDNKGGHMHRIFCSSKLVFSKDKELDSLYNEERYYNEIHGKKWTLSYLGNILKDIAECKKYLHLGSIFNSYTIANNAVRDFSKLIVNYRGYMINRDVVSMAMNFDVEFQQIASDFFSQQKSLEVKIKNLISYLEQNIEHNLREYAAVVIEYMWTLEQAVSSSELMQHDMFKEYSINMEEVLDKMYLCNIVKKDRREYKRNDGNSLVDENVYYI